MSNNPFSFKNIMTGIILGLMVFMGWLFYPEIESWYKPSAPRASETSRGIIHGKISEIIPPSEADVEKTSVKEPDKATDISSANIEAVERLDYKAALTRTQPERPGEGSHEKNKPIYGREEALFAELLKESPDPKWIKDYPFGDCFSASAARSGLPPALVLGLAGYLSNYDPKAVMDGRYGVLHLGWPRPAIQLGIESKEDLFRDPCRNIDLGCEFLAKLISQNRGEVVPALLAFRKQTGGAFTGRLADEEILYLSGLRAYVQEVLEGPFQPKTMYAFWKTDGRETAQDLIAGIEKKSGVDLWLGEDDYGYVMYIRAKSEADWREKAEKIKKATGLVGITR
jgi:hypothetical protein